MDFVYVVVHPFGGHEVGAHLSEVPPDNMGSVVRKAKAAPPPERVLVSPDAPAVHEGS